MARRSPAGPAAPTAAGSTGTITEELWQDKVAAIAGTFGWKRAHFRPALTKHGWRTPGQYEAGKGWPDLVLIHPGRQLVLFRELKTTTGRLEDDQARWRTWLTEAGADYDVWRPSDEATVLHVLGGERWALNQ